MQYGNINKKVISYSLWGNNPTYNIGAIRNAELALDVYPGFECWFYIHQESVPIDTINVLQKMEHVKIIFKSGDLNNEICKPRTWRYEAIDNEEVMIMIARDTDSRFTLREKLAVEEWLKSDKTFHIMRDHIHHNFVILGGMFGTKKIKSLENWSNIIQNYCQNDIRMYDQDFLRDYVYPLIKNDAVIHATFHKYEGELAKDFPIPYDNEFRFVGEYIYADESRSNIHIEELKNNYKPQINLITSFYIIQNPDTPQLEKRNQELLQTLINNINNPFIEKIHLYIDDINALNKVIQINKNNKIHVINVGKQPLYSDLFEYAIDNLENRLCMIANSDIYLHECDAKCLNNINNSIFSLSRYEHDLTSYVIDNRWGSYDAFIFKSPLNKSILEHMKHTQNLAGSDDNIVNILVDHNYNLYNPSFQIKIVHLHESNYRTYSSNKIAHCKYYIVPHLYS